MKLLIPKQRRLQKLRDEVYIRDHSDQYRYALYCTKGEMKYGERFWIAERIKTRMRWEYCARAKLDTFERMVAEADEFWAEYEEVNRIWIPEDPNYTKVTTGLTTATTNDIWELGAAASGMLRIIESLVGGENVASTVGRIQIHRVSSQGTTTPPTAYTPEKKNTRSPAAAGTYYGGLSAQVAWNTTQATLNTNPELIHVLNTFGGVDRWPAQPGDELYAVNAEFISERSFTGTPIISSYASVEEM